MFFDRNYPGNYEYNIKCDWIRKNKVRSPIKIRFSKVFEKMKLEKI